MSKIKTYVISCSSDVELDARGLYVWGGIKKARFLPESIKDAKRRVLKCRIETGCQSCDAEIHEVILERTKKTLKQS